jgi:hypothetical protein
LKGIMQGIRYRYATPALAFALSAAPGAAVLHARPRVATPRPHARAQVRPALPSPDAAASVDAGASVPGPLCEPVSSCGFWEDCTLLVPAPDRAHPGATSYRAVGGRYDGQRFERRHECASRPGRGPLSCQVYCTGAGAQRRCVDGMVAVDMACSETGFPQPATVECELRAGRCGRR